MLRSLLPAFAVALLLSGAAMAEDKPAAPDTHLAAALDLEAAVNAKANGVLIIRSMVPMLMSQERTARPDLSDDTAKALEQAITQEFEANIEALLQQEAVIYAKHFNESELHTLAAFYRSDIGKKYVSEMPGIMTELIPLAQAWAREVAPLAIERARKKLAAKGMKA